MDEPDGGISTAGTVDRRPEHRRIGFIGKPNITDFEAASLTYIGQCLARLGHTLVIVPAKGAVTALRVGVEAQGGSVQEVQRGVLDTSDRTLLYPDPPLLQRLEKAYPDLHTRKDLAIINDHELDEWVDVMKEILTEYNIERP